MKAHRTPRWTKVLSCALSALLAAAAAPAAADAPAARPPAPGKLASAALAAAARADARAVQAPAPAAPAATTEEPKSFLGTTRGRLALVLLAAGIGWTVYSHSHDRIKSPIR